jgi:hypothetical protein
MHLWLLCTYGSYAPCRVNSSTALIAQIVERCAIDGQLSKQSGAASSSLVAL